eukprot:CAMPEP_0174264936 /NCGR_PEP_ID=MMETSP0439-20130205/24587_1 /TAXON_ID=0 /ORGANISM="Stereomyxa ramosa, Strain Chinc5" /LENGTH=131 /DNA_ID=CAMNT_0015351109 /DNA_START=225 /DNA_END=620 /DNA_ORIENTATION=-
MTQEAKSSCHGKWYIPAGRVEYGETPVEGAIREVEEETGLIMEATGIFCVEYKPNRKRGGRYNWVRYGVTGTITGGRLKTVEDADSESLQAKWHPVDQIEDLTLRNDDFFKLIKLYQRGVTVPLVYSIRDS